MHEIATISSKENLDSISRTFKQIEFGTQKYYILAHCVFGTIWITIYMMDLDWKAYLSNRLLKGDLLSFHLWNCPNICSIGCFILIFESVFCQTKHFVTSCKIEHVQVETNSKLCHFDFLCYFCPLYEFNLRFKLFEPSTGCQSYHEKCSRWAPTSIYNLFRPKTKWKCPSTL